MPKQKPNEQVQQIPLSEIRPFKNHPFKVTDDELMQQTIDSIMQVGVLNPAIIRPAPEGGYEMVAGHRRLHAADLAGLKTIPAIVRNLDDDEAVILMVDSNLQRETISPMERAQAYKMKLEALKHQGKRVDLEGKSTSTQIAQKLSVEKVAAEAGTSRDQVRRYIRLTELLPEVQKKVDSKEIAFSPAVELSYLIHDEQKQFLDAMDYSDSDNPLKLKAGFMFSLCEQLMGAGHIGTKEKTIIDRCTTITYREYLKNNFTGTPPTLKEFHKVLLSQSEPEAKELALAVELFADGSLNTFAYQTNVATDNPYICYDIHDLGKHLRSVGMLVVLDSIYNRMLRNRKQGRMTFVFIDEIYLLFGSEYSSNFLLEQWKRARKCGACYTGISQNVEELLKSDNARTMLANSEFITLLNQAPTDRQELSDLLGISDTQLSYVSNAEAGKGLLLCAGSIVPFEDKFPKDTELYKLMTTKPREMLTA